MDSAVNLRKAHERYADAPDHIKVAIDDAFIAVYETFQNAGFRNRNDDCAEELAAAIYRYYEQCNVKGFTHEELLP